MKSLIKIFAAFAAALLAFACQQNKVLPVEISVQLFSDNEVLAQSGVTVSLADAAGTATFEAITDAAGIAKFSVNPGSYTASATFKNVEGGKKVVYNGSNTAITVAAGPVEAPFKLELQKIESQQLIIKELYSGGCMKDDASSAYQNDKYVIIYNNSEFDADASELVIGMLNPYNANSSNKYYSGDNLIYANDNWLPAGGAVYYFKNPLTIPAYSQIVIAVFGAIDHTATVSASVNLANAEYYWMSNVDIPGYTMSKYVAADVIPASHYLSGYQINAGTAWPFSNNAPALFIGKMDAASLKALCTNTEAFDETAGTGNINWAVKFPKANVIGALEVFGAAKLDASNYRFSSDINTGYLKLTYQLGYSAYRNVDKEATEALPENEGKLVYDYALGTLDVDGSTDPSGIDAEASIAAGAHIIYLQTNDSGKDFHQRKFASLKK